MKEVAIRVAITVGLFAGFAFVLILAHYAIKVAFSLLVLWLVAFVYCMVCDARSGHMSR